MATSRSRSSCRTPSQLPPLEDSTPPGYEIVSAIPTRQVVIIDLDDEAKVIESVSNASVPEGPLGTNPNLQFTIGLSGPADGNESVRVTTSAGAAPSADPANDYTPLTNQLVTFAPGATSATVNVVVAGDYDDRGHGDTDTRVVLTDQHLVRAGGRAGDRDDRQ